MNKNQKRVMVDMSATLIHHGHIRLLKTASEFAEVVVVALTRDDEIEKKKGYKPELNYNERKEILEAITFVDEVVPCNWLINEEFLNNHDIDFLIHGDDNTNDISPKRLKLFPRTEGISSSILRARVLESVSAILKQKEAL